MYDMPESDGPDLAEMLGWLDDREPPKRDFPKPKRESNADKVYRQHIANVRRQQEERQQKNTAA